MDEHEDFQARVDRLKAETAKEIEADRRRRFTPLGFHRNPNRVAKNFLIDTLFHLFVYAVFALAIGGAIIYGLFFL